MSPELIHGLRMSGDAIGAVGFIVAAIMVAVIPFDEQQKHGYTIKGLLIAGLSIYAIVLAFSVLRDSGLPSIPDVLEDNFEVIYPLVALGFVFAVYSAEQYSDVMGSRKALAASNSMMMEIMDGAPAGIMFLDPGGSIVFANRTAEWLLELKERTTGGGLAGPGWVMDGAAKPDDLSLLVDERPYTARGVTIRWPDRRTVDLVVSGTPRSNGRGALGGVVVTFETPPGFSGR